MKQITKTIPLIKIPNKKRIAETRQHWRVSLPTTDCNKVCLSFPCRKINRFSVTALHTVRLAFFLYTMALFTTTKGQGIEPIQTSSGTCHSEDNCSRATGEVCWKAWSGCDTGQCICDPRSSYHDVSLGFCRPLKYGGEACEAGDQCWEGLACINGRCRCRQGTVTSDGMYCLQNNEKLLGEHCHKDRDICYQRAKLGYTSSETSCGENGRCQCDEGYKQDGWMCRKWNIKEVGCSKDHHCQGGALCVDSVCLCPSTYVPVADYTKCAKLGAIIDLQIGDVCDEINEDKYCAYQLVCHQCTGSTVHTCVKSCGVGKFWCTNNRCIKANWVCDGHDDCYDNSDERSCNDCKIHVGSFGCADNSTCIDPALVCDGDCNCSLTCKDEEIRYCYGGSGSYPFSPISLGFAVAVIVALLFAYGAYSCFKGTYKTCCKKSTPNTNRQNSNVTTVLPPEERRPDILGDLPPSYDTVINNPAFEFDSATQYEEVLPTYDDATSPENVDSSLPPPPSYESVQMPDWTQGTPHQERSYTVYYNRRLTEAESDSSVNSSVHNEQTRQILESNPVHQNAERQSMESSSNYEDFSNNNNDNSRNNDTAQVTTSSVCSEINLTSSNSENNENNILSSKEGVTEPSHARFRLNSVSSCSSVDMEETSNIQAQNNYGFQADSESDTNDTNDGPDITASDANTIGRTGSSA